MQESNQIILLPITDLERAYLVIQKFLLDTMGHTTTIGIKIDHIPERPEPPVVHVGSRKSNISQGRDLERPLVPLPLDLEPAQVRAILIQIGYPYHLEIRIIECWDIVTLKAAGLEGTKYIQPVPLTL